MHVTPAQEAYFLEQVPGNFKLGHMALLEVKDAGVTRITYQDEEIGRIVLDGSRPCQIVMTEAYDHGIFDILAVMVDR